MRTPYHGVKMKNWTVTKSPCSVVSCPTRWSLTLYWYLDFCDVHLPRLQRDGNKVSLFRWFPVWSWLSLPPRHTRWWSAHHKILDVISSPSSYPCQWVSELVSGSAGDSFRCDAIVFPSFASLLLIFSFCYHHLLFLWNVVFWHLVMVATTQTHMVIISS